MCQPNRHRKMDGRKSSSYCLDDGNREDPPGGGPEKYGMFAKDAEAGGAV